MDHVLYYKQSAGLTDSGGRRISEADIPRLRPGELKSFELNMLDYSFENGDVLYVAGDTDCKDSTPLKIVGTSISALSATKTVFTLGSTQAYADLWNSVANPNGILVLWIQLQVSKADGRIHRLVFQMRGAPAVGGDFEPLENPQYVTSDQLSQGVASGISGHNQSETAHPDIRELMLNGTAGKSAYQVAVDNGFVGTEAEWLASLKGQDGNPGQDGAPGQNGAPGQDGADGKSAYQLAVDGGFQGTEAEWLASLNGSSPLRWETHTIVAPSAIYPNVTDVCLCGRLPAGISIKRVYVTTDNGENVAFAELRYADSFIGRGNSPLLVCLLGTTAGERDEDDLDVAVAAGKCLFVAFGQSPSINVNSISITIAYQVA